MINTLLFDADGVLIKPDYRLSQKLTRDFNVPFEAMESFFTTDFVPCLIGEADLKQTITPYLPLWNWTGSVDEFLDYWFQSENSPDIDMLSLVKELRSQGLLCALATNQEKHRLNFIQSQMEFSSLFDKFFCSCDLGYLKPQLMYYQLIYQQLGAPDKSSILFIDDSDRNIAGAESFGFLTYHFTNFKTFAADITKLLPELNETS